MQHAHLVAQTRDITGRKTDSLRAEGQVPAVMYGFGTEPVSLVVDRNAFNKVYAHAGESTVVDLEVNGTVHPVLIADIQRDVITDFFTHADFRRVDISKKIEANIPLTLIGESNAVKNLGGTLVQSLEELEVLALPNKLVSEIEVDIAKLETFDDVLRVSDIVVPEGIEVKTDGETAVASVQEPRSEEELAALNEAVDIDVSQVEVTSEKKDDEAAAGESKE